MFHNTQMFLIMDDPVPEHIKQTFKLSQTRLGWESDLSGLNVNVRGEDIDLSAAGYLIVYANDDWHHNAAIGLHDQLKALRYDAMILGIPVEVEVKEVESNISKYTITGNIMPMPPFPGKP